MPVRGNSLHIAPLNQEQSRGKLFLPVWWKRWLSEVPHSLITTVIKGVPISTFTCTELRTALKRLPHITIQCHTCNGVWTNVNLLDQIHYLVALMEQKGALIWSLFPKPGWYGAPSTVLKGLCYVLFFWRLNFPCTRRSSGGLPVYHRHCNRYESRKGNFLVSIWAPKFSKQEN